MQPPRGRFGFPEYCTPGEGNHAIARGRASTWTYLINDDPFTDWKLGLISGGNLGTAAMTPLVLLANLPLVLVVFLIRKFKRWRGGGNGKE